jgi:hypothetical protein
MRKRILRALLILGLVAGSGVAVAAAAGPAIGAVGCIDSHDPHHNVKVFWTAGRVCPAGHYGIADAFGGSGSGAPGPAGPAGPKGDPGDSVIKVISKQVTLTSSSPATQTVVLTGLPAKASGVVELPVDNSGSAPAGTTVTVTPLAVPAGSTERSFTVGVSGFTTQTFGLSLKVLAVSA